MQNQKPKSYVVNNRNKKQQKLAASPEQLAEIYIWLKQYCYIKKRYLNLNAKILYIGLPLSAFMGLLILGNMKNANFSRDLNREMELWYSQLSKPFSSTSSDLAFIDIIQLLWFCSSIVSLAFLNKTWICPYIADKIYEKYSKDSLERVINEALRQDNGLNENIQNLQVANKTFTTSTSCNLMVTMLLNIFVFSCISYFLGRNSVACTSYIYFGDLIDLINALNELLLDYRTNRILEKKKSLLIQALSPYADIAIGGAALICTRNSPAYYYFIIQSKAFRSLDSTVICQMIGTVFTKAGMRPLSMNGEKMMVSGNASLNAKKIAGIHKELLSLIERIHERTEHIQVLQRKLMKLNAVINNQNELITLTTKDIFGPTLIEVELFIPSFFAVFFTKEKLAAIFTFTNIGLCFQDVLGKGLKLKMTASKVNKDLLFVFLNELRDVYFRNSLDFEEEGSLESSWTATKVIHKKGSKDRDKASTAMIQPKPSTPDQVPRSLKPHIVIHWKSAIYDSIDPHCQVFYLRDLSKHRPLHSYFGFFTLTVDDFGGNRREHKKFKAKAMRGKDANDKGEEGYKFLKGNEKTLVLKDKNGESYVPDVKLKVLGLFGRRRGLGRLEYSLKSSQGKPGDEVLVVIDNALFTH